MNFLLSLLTISLLALCAGCSKNEQPQKKLVLYTSLDRPHSEPIVKLFEERTGIDVQVVYDAEAAKTVGLVNRLIAEKENPQADVFWNSEVLRTLVLKKKGILDPYASPEAETIPQHMKDPEHYWTGFAVRARVILYNTNLVENPPKSLEDLTLPKWQGKVAIANPLFGTTNTQLAQWWADWGPEKTKSYLSRLTANDVVICAGNAMAKNMVASGEIPVCLTDTDDAWSAIVKGHPVAMSYPDQANGRGTLMIPNTVAMVKGGNNTEEARAFIDFLLSPEVETILAKSESAQIPLREVADIPPHVKDFNQLVQTKTDFERASASVMEAGKYAKEHFQPK